MQSLGNRDVDIRLGLTMDFEPSLVFRSLDDNIVQALVARESGLAIYLDAMNMQSSIAQYRELWKVLESAFLSKDGTLINLLFRFSPVQKLGFNLEEIKELLKLRGRASHAESKAGLVEYKKVARDTATKAKRLKSLVEEVLITKQSWGNRSLSHFRIADLMAFVNNTGQLTIIMHGSEKTDLSKKMNREIN